MQQFTRGKHLKTLMILDDEQALCDLFEMFFSMDERWECKCATSRASAEEILNSEDLDIIVSDFHLADFDQDSLASFLQNAQKINEGATKVVLFSGDISANSFADKNGYIFVEKPSSISSIKKMCDEIVGM